MSRSYSEASYGGRQIIQLATDVGLTTNAALTTLASHKFLYPCKVVDANMVFIGTGEGAFGTCTVWTLAKSTDLGTGSTVFATIDAAEASDTTTFAKNETLDVTVTETTFSAGDSVLFQIEGTVGEIASDVVVNLEVQELFEQADT